MPNWPSGSGSASASASLLVELIAGAHRRGWMQEGSRRIATLTLPLVTFLVASTLGGNPFVAAFAGGVSFGATAPADAASSIELTELLAKLFSYALVVHLRRQLRAPRLREPRRAHRGLRGPEPHRGADAAGRVSFVGSGVDRSTTAFIGWFGPRGLASVVFALLAVEELGGANPQVLVAVDTITVTVVFSIMAHGFSGRPLATELRHFPTGHGRRARSGAALTMVAVVSSMSLGFTAPPPSE